MGTWGTRIYDDDTALDVRQEFLSHIATLPAHKRTWREHIADVEQSIYGEFKGDDADTVTLALCCVELEKGLLTEETKRNTLEVIGSGRDIARWEDAASEDLTKRKHELTLIRKYIEKYDGKPVKRKSWVELQKGDLENNQSEAHQTNDIDGSVKLDDVDWHMADKPPKNIEESIFDRYAAQHIGCFAYWLITRGYFAYFDKESNKYGELVGKLTIEPAEFVVGTLDMTLISGFVTEPQRKFAEAYYSQGDISYFQDYETLVQAGRTPYSFRLTPVEYNKMAKKIDARYKEYLGHPENFVQPKNANLGLRPYLCC